MDSWYCGAPFNTCVTPQHIVWEIEVVIFLANKWQCWQKGNKTKKKKKRKNPEKQQQQPPKTPKQRKTYKQCKTV